MATSHSRADGRISMRPRTSSEYGGMGGERERNTVRFDADTPPGVDPEAAWRFQNSGKHRRTGATSADRAGMTPGYTPGYGRASAQNSGGGVTPQNQWDELFSEGHSQSNLHSDFAGQSDINPFPSAPAAPPVLPRAANSPSAPQTPPVASTQHIAGLPAGQSASATFIPGQNSPANLALRTPTPLTIPSATAPLPELASHTPYVPPAPSGITRQTHTGTLNPNGSNLDTAIPSGAPGHGGVGWDTEASAIHAATAGAGIPDWNSAISVQGSQMPPPDYKSQIPKQPINTPKAPIAKPTPPPKPTPIDPFS